MTTDHENCCTNKGWCKQPGALLHPEIKARLAITWKRLLGSIDPAHAAFPLEARRDILEALDCCCYEAAESPAKAVIAGFFYRDNDADGAFCPDDTLTATLLGAPALSGHGSPEAKLYSTCYWFGPVQPGQRYTVNYNVDGVESFSQEVAATPGLNLVHLPVAPTKPLVYICPHAHFDPEWTETYERYMAIEIPNIIDRVKLLRDEPAHCFSLDEEASTRTLLERRPDIKDELRQRIVEGVVEPKGTVVATEFNMPLGESMIRQMLVGEQILSDMLGLKIRPNILWNIDNYGVSFQIPQILLKAGRSHVMLGEYRQVSRIEHMKRDMPFSDERVWDHSEFWWEALDGSKVLCHRSPYFATPFAPHVPDDRVLSHRSAFNFQGTDFSPPNRELMEKVKELNAADGPYKFIVAPSESFMRAVEAAPDVPTFRTESRMGLWTGSYETRVRGRQLNREVECLLLAAETLTSAAGLLGLPVNKPALREAWYTLLINQHHDPQLAQMFEGLFPEVIRRYEDAKLQASKLLEAAMHFIIYQAATNEQRGIPVVVFNSLAQPRTGVVPVTVRVPDGSTLREAGTFPLITDASGRPVPMQMVQPDPDAEPTKMVFLAEDVPATGWKVFYLDKDGNSPDLKTDVSVSETHIENEHVRVEFEAGQAKRVILKDTGKCLFEAAAEAGVNEIFIWHDEGCICTVKPYDFANQARLVARSSQVQHTLRIIEAGPARAVVESSFQLEGGAFRQQVILEAGSRRAQFRTSVDWTPHETEGRRIRVAFASAEKDTQAWRDIPFGVVEWEQTDTIMAVNTWLGLATSDGSHGAALLPQGMCSACLSHDVMWLTLFRSVRMTQNCEWGWNITGDHCLEPGENTYDYSLYPYAGTWQTAAVPQASMQVNTPMFSRQGPRLPGAQPREASMLAIEPHDLVQVTWKPSDFSGATIVRIYNPTGEPVDGCLTVGFPVARIDETNFREEPAGALTIEDGKVKLEFGPYEIKTVRLFAANR